MDLAFSRRHAFVPVALDLATLLARMSAAQAATPTARAQMKLDLRREGTGEADARIALFANSLAIDTHVSGASFAAMFSPRQPK